jgi:protein-S-isoprenylcysteine O-methyltransferase Ste14
MYSSLLLLAWGVFFKRPAALGLALALAATALLAATARAEERENIAYFGSGYSEYMQRTKRFLPFLY